MALNFIGIFSKADDSKLIFSSNIFTSVSQNVTMYNKPVCILIIVFFRAYALPKPLAAI